jgi:site-specific DNA-methyltransferase (adenine-specific)
MSVLPLNQILCGDSVAKLKELPAESIDMVVTSPPYDDIRFYSDEFTAAFDKTLEDFENDEKQFSKALNNFRKERVRQKLEENNGYSFPFEQIATELNRVLKPGGTITWVVGDAVVGGSESGSSFRQALFFKSLKLNLHDTMIYEKNGTAFPARRDGNRYSQIFEYMFVFSKGKPKTHNLICDKPNKWTGWGSFNDNFNFETLTSDYTEAEKEDLFQSIGKTLKSMGYSETQDGLTIDDPGFDFEKVDYSKLGIGISSMRGKDGELKSRIQKPVPEFSPRNNIWKYNTGKKFSSKDDIAFEHPAIFPETLAEDHILTWTNEGDVVLDPFVGSGTATKMAHINNRNWIGIDISEEYANLALERMDIAAALKKSGYKREIVSSSQKTITSDGKLSHKEISSMGKKEMLETMLKWQNELVDLKKRKKG